MKRNSQNHIVSLLVCILFSLPLLGKTVVLSTAVMVSPYIFHTTNSGFELDIVREAFKLEGYEVKFVFLPLLRSKISFKKGGVDGVMTIKKHYPEVQGAYISHEYIAYHNYAVSLQSQNFKINSITDLENKKIDAFQQATLALGEEFKRMTTKNTRYNEIANQKNQIAKLFGKRSDVIILDRLIFHHYRRELKKHSTLAEKISFDQPVVFHNLFAPSKFRIAFFRKTLRDSFNRGLLKLKQSGRYQKIIRAYEHESSKVP